MSPRDESRDPNPIVCHCMAVDLGTIRTAIASGARTITEIQDATGACLGCGTCRFDLLQLLAEAGPLGAGGAPTA